MLRNLDRRVEVFLPMLDPELKAYLKDVYLDAYLRDNVNARTLRPDGTYKKVTGTKERFDAQMHFVGREIPH
jgi:polyphosphate kinase